MYKASIMDFKLNKKGCHKAYAATLEDPGSPGSIAIKILEIQLDTYSHTGSENLEDLAIGDAIDFSFKENLNIENEESDYLHYVDGKGWGTITAIEKEEFNKTIYYNITLEDGEAEDL